MCSCSHCRNLFALGLVFAVVVTHEPQHAHVPTPRERQVALGSVATARSSSSSTGSVFVSPGTGGAVWTGLAPTATVSNSDRLR